MSKKVTNAAEMAHCLKLGLCPPTDSLDLLASLGFRREYPKISSGEKAHRWVREITQKGTNRKILTMQRATLSFIASSDAGASVPARKTGRMHEAHALNRRVIAAALATTAA